MKAIAVDDEIYALKDSTYQLSTVPGITEVTGFTDPQLAIKYLRENIVDVALLDIEMPGMSGIELARQIKEVSASTVIIFLTAYSEYALEAYKIKANGYLLKPASASEISKEIEHVFEFRPKDYCKRVQVRTFGRFEIYCDGAPIAFKEAKTKEMLAYLVHKKGVTVSIAELAAVLWPGCTPDETRKNLKVCMVDMLEALRKKKADKIVKKNKDLFLINTDYFDCDYYDFLRGDVTTINSYTGAYMTGYSWAHFTAEALNTQKSNDSRVL
ncbi:MAG: response regulator [Clostridia bacterium]|nr:response regulator [Clostridia bacterium]